LTYISTPLWFQTVDRLSQMAPKIRNDNCNGSLGLVDVSAFYKVALE